MKRYLLFIILALFSPLGFGQISINPTGNLNTPRIYHETQTLPDGRVLTFGGYQFNGVDVEPGYYKSSEIYDVNLGTWSYSADMNAERASFASAILPDGKLLAVGGTGPNGKLSSCELFDPVTETWTYTASMNEAREGHRAIVLPNGKVLVVGGNDYERCEIFDPATKTWRYSGAMTIAHGRGASLTLMNNGKVLATGGTLNNGVNNVGEVFDPITENWSMTSKMAFPRAFHSSISMFDGSVLLVGSGQADINPMKTSEIYYPTSNSFMTSADLTAMVGYSPLIALDGGLILSYGLGDIGSPQDTKQVQVYSPYLNKWTGGGVYHDWGATAYCISRLKNGRIMVCGGSEFTDMRPTKKCVLLDPYNTSCTTFPNIILTGTNVCAGNNANVVLSSPESGVSYQAFIGDRSVSPIQSGSGTITFTLSWKQLNAGQNVIHVKAMSTCLPYILSDTAIVTVTESPSIPPTINASGPLTFCKNSNVNLSATGFNSYLWSLGPTYSSISVNVSGIYSVRGVDENGCATAPSATVTTKVNPNFVLAGSDQQICINNPPALLTEFSPMGGTWTGPGINANGVFSPAVAGAGTYTLTYSSCGSIATKKVTVIPMPFVNDFYVRPTDSICANETAKVVVQNPQVGVTYGLRKGTTGIGFGVTPSSSYPITFDAGYLSATTVYSIQGFVSNSCGTATVIKNDTLYKLADPSPQPVFVKDIICKDEVPTFKIPNSNINYYYRLRGYGSSTNFVPTRGNGDTLVLKGDGETYYTVEVSNIKQCNWVTLLLNKYISYFTSSTDFYIDPGYYPNEQFTVTNFSNGDYYKWKFGNSAQFSTSTLSSPVNSYATEGLKMVQLISISKYGCVDSITKSTYIFKPASVSNGVACFMDTIDCNKNANPIIYKVHTDKNNNTYVAGVTRSAIGGDYLGSNNFFLTKFNNQGKTVWTIKQNPLDYYYSGMEYYSSFITGIATDTLNNVYITGNYASNYIKFGNITRSHSNSANQFYIAKINESGSVQWLINTDNPDRDSRSGGSDILYVDDEHIYACAIKPINTLFTDGVAKTFYNEFVILQIDKEGRYRNHVPGQDLSSMESIMAFYNNPNPETLDSRKLAFVTPKLSLSKSGRLNTYGWVGVYTGTITLGNTSMEKTLSNGNAFVATIDTSGMFWSSAFITFMYGGNSSGYFNMLPAFATDGDDNIYMSESYDFGQDYLHKDDTDTTKLSNGVALIGREGTAISKYSPSGDLLWNKLMFGPSQVNSISISPDDNEVYCYGNFTNAAGFAAPSSLGTKATGLQDIFLSCIDKNGNPKWMEKIGSSQDDSPLYMQSDDCGTLTLSGFAGGRADLKASSLPSTGGYFISRYSPSGNCVSKCKVEIPNPKVSITSNADSITGVPFTIKITFSKKVTGFDISDFVVTNGTVSEFDGTDSIFSALITPSNYGITKVVIPSKSAFDNANYGNLKSNTFTIMYDNKAPVLTIKTLQKKTNAKVFIAEILSDEYITGVDLSDFISTNATVDSIKFANGSYYLFSHPLQLGEFSIKIAASAVKDFVGNYNDESNTIRVIYDTIAPIVAITTTASGTTADPIIPITFTFSEPVLDFSLSDVDVNFGSISNLSGSGQQYTAVLTAYRMGTGVAVRITSVLDSAGNYNLKPSNFLQVAYMPSPIPFIQTNSPSITNSSPIPFSISFDNGVKGFESSDIAITNGLVSNFTQITDRYYEFSVDPLGQGQITLRVPENSATNVLGLGNSESLIKSINYDSQNPTVIISSNILGSTPVTSIPISFAFSEPVTDFDVTKISVSNGYITDFSGSNMSYTAILHPSDKGTVAVYIPSFAVRDIANNGSETSNQLSILYSDVKPSGALSCTCSSTTNSSPLVFTLTFSGSILGLTTSDIAITNGVLNSLTSVSEGYQLIVSPTANGQVTVTVAANGVTDAIGQTLVQDIVYSLQYDTEAPFADITFQKVDENSLITTFHWNEPVVGFNLTDVNLAGGTISSFSGSGDTYIAEIIPEGAENLTVSINYNAATDASGNSSTQNSSTYANGPDGIGDASSGSLLTIYPNPSVGMINILLNQKIEEGEIEVVSSDGKIVRQQMINGKTSEFEFNLENLPVGIYLIKLSFGDKLFYHTQILEK